ncbi:hypothetical protein COR50_08805 [Chitinophaga caeni]|uniref:Uncharacterized protein n=1 Tax=Chitinophaga caeni TaxID=2029983 RepID=A0A291QTT7_9BACT|nr:hypothetical protein [Chitinophaga caeni]ATL47264.1 hypothetical protein COR50_08805 [Chitinophaga caeni]
MKKIFLCLLLSIHYCLMYGQSLPNIYPDTSNVGLGTLTPAARLHVNNKAGTYTIAKFTIDGVSPNVGHIDLGNATGTIGTFIPNLIARSYFPTPRPVGMIITSFIPDIDPWSTTDSTFAAFNVDSRSQDQNNKTLNLANVFAVKNNTKPLLMMKANGNTGINMLNPIAPLHVSSTNGGSVAKFSYNHVSTNSQAYIEFANSTSAPGQYIPLIRGQSLTPSDRPFGIIIQGMAQDIKPNGNEPNAAAVMIDGRSKQWTTLQNNNVLSVCNLGAPLMIMQANGNMLLGTTQDSPHKLTVEGSVGARKVVVKQDAWADFVFDDDYDLLPISELAAFIQKNKHLPGIPTTKEVEENGQDIGEMNKLLLQKVEELTLYMLELKKENDALKERVQKLEKQ